MKLDSLRLLQAYGSIANGHILRFGGLRRVLWKRGKIRAREKNKILDDFCLGPSFQIWLLFLTALQEGKYIKGCQASCFKLTVRYNAFGFCLENVNGNVTGRPISWFKEVRGSIRVPGLFLYPEEHSFEQASFSFHYFDVS